MTLTFTPNTVGPDIVVTTDATGAYSVVLPPDIYDLVASRPGYGDDVQVDLDATTGSALTVNTTLPPMPLNEYIGSTDCGVCHSGKLDTFQRSGHPFKINRVTGGVAPTYPFTSLSGVLPLINDDDTDPADPGPGTDNTLGTPTSWNDVSYVIGGYGWKARIMDLNGFIVTGSEVQYNFFASAMSGYHDNDVDKPFNCGNCHTTGWKHFDATLNNARQDGRPGMDGTFALTGIQCESCHGAGSGHAQTLLAVDITRVATPRTTADFLLPDMAYGMAVSCGECHTRDGERDHPTYQSAYDNARLGAGQPILAMGGRIAASGGLIRHHEQHDEIMGVDPDDPLLDSTRSVAFMGAHGNCTTCHDSHVTTRYEDVSGDPPGSSASCTTCHPSKVITTGGMTSLECQDCHMPLLAKSATLTFDPPPGDDRPALGDVRSHIFKIDLSKDPATQQITPTGSFAYPWITGDYACRRCHSNSGPAFPITFPSSMTIHQ